MESSSDTLIHFIRSTAPIVSQQKAEEIATHFHEREIDKGQYFLKEGTISNEYLFLLDGFMRSYALDTEGNDITTAFSTAHEVVFEVSSFFNRTVSRENIVAITACNGLSLSYTELNNLFHALPEFREFGRAILVKGFASLKARMLSTITETAEERYLRLLNTNPDIFKYAPLKTVATYLGITDTSLSRIRKELSAK